MLKSKWEEEIVRYAGEHHEAYPTFSKFSAMIQDEARKRNHPYVSAGVSTANGMRKVVIARSSEENRKKPPFQPGVEVKQPLKTNTGHDSGKTPEKKAPEPQT